MEVTWQIFNSQKLQKVAYQGSTTGTHLALRYILKHDWNTPEKGARNGSQVIILITDGRSENPDQSKFCPTVRS